MRKFLRLFWPEYVLALILLLVLTCCSFAGPCECGPGCRCGPECDCFILKQFQPTQATADQGATITLHCAADAIVTLDGQATQAKGSCRIFKTPPLKPYDGRYSYKLKIETDGWCSEKTVYVWPGAQITVDCPCCSQAAASFQAPLFFGGNCAGGQCGMGGPMFFGGGLMGGGCSSCAGGRCR